MLVTLLGMMKEVKPEQTENAPSPMLVTLLGMIVFLQPDISVLDEVSMIALQLLRESYFLLPDSTLIEVRPEQPANASHPMLATRLGIVMEVRLEQPKNA